MDIIKGLYRSNASLTVILLNICFVSAAIASPESRKWEFEIQTPGKYKLEVTYSYPDGSPQNKRATYFVHTKERRYQRTLFLTSGQSNKPFTPLAPDIISVQTAVVEMVGASQEVLDNTEVKLTLTEKRNYQAQKMPAKHKPVEFEALSILKTIFALPEDEIDLGRAKLKIDSLVDPTLDVSQGEKQLSYIVNDIKMMLPSNPTYYDKLIALTRYLYDSGSWNSYSPYQYDFSDPLGTKLSNKLLMNYISSKRGNCISMPFLFIALGERLALPLTGSTAPLHVFVKFTDDINNRTISLETTSGANPSRDTWYQEQFQITDKAIRNGAYLATLSKKQTVAVMAVILSEYYLEIGEYEKAIAIAELSLQYYPNFIYAMLKLGNAYHLLADKLFLKKYPTLADVPVNQRGYYKYLSRNNHMWFQRAESLGWVQPSEEFDQRYLDMVSQDAKSLP